MIKLKLEFNLKTIGYWPRDFSEGFENMSYWLFGRVTLVYFLIKEMVDLDEKLSNRYFSLNTLKVWNKKIVVI
jgi:hypothetical protein